jgi:hypothetical protein
MPFEEYAAQPFSQKHELFKFITEICLAKVQGDYTGLSQMPVTSFFNDKLSCLYLNTRDLNKYRTSSDQS